MERFFDKEKILESARTTYDEFIEWSLGIFFRRRSALTIKKKIEKKPLKCFILMFTLLVGFLVPSVLFWSVDSASEYYEHIYNVFTFGLHSIQGVEGVTKATSTLLNAFNKFFSVSLPLTLTFYYFIYREQKSISSTLAKGILLWLYLSTTILNLLLGYFIIFNKMYLTDELFLSKFFFSLIVWSILVVFSFVFFFLLLNRLLGSLDIGFLFKHTRQVMRGKITELYYSNVNREDNYERLNICLESTFQSFEYTMDKGLDKLFEKELKEWDSILVLLMDEAPRKQKRHVITANKLVEDSAEDFVEFYRLILKKQGDLLFKLAEKKRLSTLKEVLGTLRSLEPNKIEVLYPAFITALDEIVLKAYKQKNFPLARLLEILNSIILSYKVENNDERENRTNIAKVIAVIYIYETLLKEAIEADNVKDITSVTYSLCDIFKEFTKKEPQNEVNQKTQNIENPLNAVAMMSAMENSMQNTKVSLDISTNEKIKKIILFILLQMALKSVELSHYKCLGQIVKRITTDFDAKTIGETFNDFRKANGNIKDTSILEDDLIRKAINSKESMISHIHIDVAYNNQSLDYCMQKLALLIFGQQYYIMKQELTFTEYYQSCEGQDKRIDLSFIDMKYIDYTLGKIKKVGTGYGLLFIDESEFADEVKAKFRELTY
ncbi:MULTISPECIES: hypothetical protein [Bacillus cereus group]|uniref:hypothetical protein n=1 Tax=Bacillus cereus group TaxID=86661 RepID=UPI000BEFFC2C|nr:MULTISPECIES: hypothetical protein [Bacillus cereus group]PEM33031.1 hypothetical protein CN617_00530 [Bacillus wiedmannii]QCU12090.1 hypothetical protein BCPR1_20895 [Bacillus paranthracis]